MTDELMALADRVEALTGPCREADAEIAQAVGQGPTGFASGKAGRWITWPAFTSSLDAAMTLKTGFILCHLSEIGGDGLPLCILGDPSTTPSRSWNGFSFSSGPILEQLARATTAAALRARAAKEPEA